MEGIDDYAGTGANTHHDPKPPGRVWAKTLNQRWTQRKGVDDDDHYLSLECVLPISISTIQ